MKISETKKDYSACHTDNKLSFLSQERGKIHFENEFIFFHVNFMLPKCTFTTILGKLYPGF